MIEDRTRFAMMTTGETTVEFASEDAATATGVAPRFNRVAAAAAAWQLAFVAQDVPAYDRAVAAGAVAEVPSVQKPWGQTLGYLRALNGCLVELASRSGW